MEKYKKVVGLVGRWISKAFSINFLIALSLYMYMGAYTSTSVRILTLNIVYRIIKLIKMALKTHPAPKPTTRRAYV